MIYTDEDLNNNFGEDKENTDIIQEEYSEYFETAEEQIEINKNSEILHPERKELERIQLKLQDLEKKLKKEQENKIEKLAWINYNLEFFQCEVKNDKLIIDENITELDWSTIGRKLKLLGQNISWLIFDWIKFGEKKGFLTSDIYDKLEKSTGYSRRTLQDIKYVGDNTATGQPVARGIPFYYCKEVVRLEPDKQKELIQKAINEKLTQKQLREEVKKLKESNQNNEIKTEKIYKNIIFKVKSIKQQYLELNQDQKQLFKKEIENLLSDLN